jgi:hypothetical protein
MDYIVSGSEDGNVYIWDCICDQTLSQTKQSKRIPHQGGVFNKKDRIKSYEYFQPFANDNVSVSVATFAPIESVKIQASKYQRLPFFKNGHPSPRHMLLVCATDGVLRVFMNEKAPDPNKINEEDDEDEEEDEEYVETYQTYDDYEMKIAAMRTANFPQHQAANLVLEEFKESDQPLRIPRPSD